MYNYITATKAHFIYQDNETCWICLYEVLNDDKINRKINNVNDTKKLSQIFINSYKLYLSKVKSKIIYDKVFCKSNALKIMKTIANIKSHNNIIHMKATWNNYKIHSIRRRNNFKN